MEEGGETIKRGTGIAEFRFRSILCVNADFLKSRTYFSFTGVMPCRKYLLSTRYIIAAFPFLGTPAVPRRLVQGCRHIVASTSGKKSTPLQDSSGLVIENAGLSRFSKALVFGFRAW